MPFLLSNWKLIAAAAYTAVVFFAGWHVHTLSDAASQLKTETKMVDAAHKAESGIIKFHQQVGTQYDKDPCFNTLIPSQLNELLK